MLINAMAYYATADDMFLRGVTVESICDLRNRAAQKGLEDIFVGLQVWISER